jgi:hypothetical protein
MTHRDSSYYPRRASAWSPLLGRFDGCGRMLKRLAFHVPDSVTLLGLVGGFLVPGLAVYLRNPDRSGKATLGVCAALILTFIVFLGYPVANAAFTLLLSIHLVGLVAYCKPILVGAAWPNRLLTGLLLSAVTIVFVYIPLQNLMEHRLVLPLRVRGHVVVVRCLSSPGVIRRGDWIVFNFSGGRNYFNDGQRHGNVIIEDGINLAAVLAVAGDKLVFTPKSFSVNGVEQPRLPNMPGSGEWTVPEMCWFAWPDLGISGHGTTPEANISEATMEIATVHRTQFVGRVFRHWFWRRQLFS